MQHYFSVCVCDYVCVSDASSDRIIWEWCRHRLGAAASRPTPAPFPACVSALWVSFLPPVRNWGLVRALGHCYRDAAAASIAHEHTTERAVRSSCRSRRGAMLIFLILRIINICASKSAVRCRGRGHRLISFDVKSLVGGGCRRAYSRQEA